MFQRQIQIIARTCANVHKGFKDHDGLTTGKESSLGGMLLHCGRRVEQQNYAYETTGSHGGGGEL